MANNERRRELLATRKQLAALIEKMTLEEYGDGKRLHVNLTCSIPELCGEYWLQGIDHNDDEKTDLNFIVLKPIPVLAKG